MTARRSGARVSKVVRQVFGVSEQLMSARFWFESFQNRQSEFLAIASMVWLAVYLRQR